MLMTTGKRLSYASGFHISAYCRTSMNSVNLDLNPSPEAFLVVARPRAEQTAVCKDGRNMVLAAENCKKRGGFTLVEVMVASVMFVMVTVGLMVSILESYRLVTKAKCSNEARYALRSIADQFLQAKFNLVSVSTTKNPSGVTLFSLTDHTGLGMAWRKDVNSFSFLRSGDTEAERANTYIEGGANGLVVPLSATGTSGLTMTLTRRVTNITPSLASGSSTTAAGSVYQGEFTATFTIGGKTYSETITALRATR